MLVEVFFFFACDFKISASAAASGFRICYAMKTIHSYNRFTEKSEKQIYRIKTSKTLVPLVFILFFVCDFVSSLSKRSAFSLHPMSLYTRKDMKNIRNNSNTNSDGNSNLPARKVSENKAYKSGCQKQRGL